MMTRIVIFAIFALSLNLLWGYGGLISLGHATFFGVGAYLSTIVIVRMGIGSFWVPAIIAVVAAGLLAAVYGVIALRVKGLYFLLVTLALGQLMFYVADRWRSLTGGSNGIIGIPYPDMGVGGITLDSISYYYFVLLIAAGCYFLLYRIVHSPFGQALQGIRDDEKKMQSLGYNTWLHKYIAYVLAGMFAAVAGVLFSYFLVVVAPPQLSIETSTMAILMVIIGSTRVFWGPVAGAVVVILLQSFASVYVPQRWPLLLGAVFVVAVMFMKEGIGISLLRLYGRMGSLVVHHYPDRGARHGPRLRLGRQHPGSPLRAGALPGAPGDVQCDARVREIYMGVEIASDDAELVDIHTYYGESYVLRGVSLSIPGGTVVGLLVATEWARPPRSGPSWGSRPPARGRSCSGKEIRPG